MRTRTARDDGFALPSVIAIFMIVSIVSLTLAGMAVHAVGFSTSVRASVQSRAAADSGINVVLRQMGDESLDINARFPCSHADDHTHDPSVTGDVDLTYSLVIHYFDAAGSELNCGGSTLTVNMADTPVKAVIDSTGTAAAKGAAGQSSGDVRTVTSIATIDIEQHLDTSATINSAVFTDGDITVTNATHITDSLAQNGADVYTNGDVVCDTSQNFAVQGSIYAQGNVTLDNPCVVNGDVWAGGTYSTPSGNVSVGKNVLLASNSASDLDDTWVNGDIVSNGPISLSGAGNQATCSLIGKAANVCGSVTSIYGTVSLSSNAAVGGDAQAKGDVKIAETNKTSVYGNVRSTAGSMVATGSSNTHSVGGYVAVAGTEGMSLDDIGNTASTCGSSGPAPACPATPTFSIAALPTELNYPTNTSVVAPPRYSLPAIMTTPAALNAWNTAGWNNTVQATGCTLPASVYSGISSKTLVIVSGCTAPLVVSNQIKLSGDLAIFSPSGIDFTHGNGAITSNSGTHVLQVIVPTDANKPDGAALVSWTNPIPTDPNYFKYSCDQAGLATSNGVKYGNVYLDNNFSPSSSVNTFFFTPCDFSTGNSVGTLNGEVYSSTTGSGNSESVNYVPIDVPGAVHDAAGGGVWHTTVAITESSRFDAKG